MLKSYKERSLVDGQQVLVYFNTHEKSFSVADAKTKLVLAHGDNVVVHSPQFVVSEAGRLKTVAENRKRVHAYIQGTYVGVAAPSTFNQPMDQVYYNPFKQDKFTVINTATDANTKKYSTAILSGKNVYTF